MKKLIFLTIIILTAYLILNNSRQEDLINISDPLPSSKASTSILEKLEPVSFNNQTYLFSWSKIPDLKNLKLYPNFKDAAESKTLIQKNHCSTLINGGFYGKDNQPIGWLVVQGKTISNSVISRLLNGYLSINENLSISPTRPTQTPRIGLQSGPLLILDSKPLLLNIKNDENRRRSIAAQTIDNHLVFIIVTGQESQFSGPLLQDTPKVILAISEKINLKFKSAINLDGGSASAFYFNHTHLEELSPIGSYFCYN